MKPNLTVMLALAALLLLAPVQAQDFVDENDADAVVNEVVSIADAATDTISVYRNFTVDNATEFYVSLVDTLPEGYSVDLYHTLDGTTYTLLAAGVETTDPSVYVGTDALGLPGIRIDLGLPEVDLREANAEDSIAFIIGLNSTIDQGGNGGTLSPSIGQVINVFYYDAATDSDADGLPDEWEDEHFGNLDQLGSDDPDGDGFTNAEEYEAGSDPNDPASTPQQVVVSGGGVTVNDRELGLSVLGFFLFVITAAALAFWAPRKSTENKLVATALAIGAGIILIMLVLFGFDHIELGGTGWAFWAYFGATWQEVVFTGSLMILLGIAATVTFMRVKQSTEDKAVWGFLAAGAVIIAGCWLIFGYFDVAVPFIE